LQYLRELVDNDAVIPIMEDEDALVAQYYQKFTASAQNDIEHFAFCPTLSCNCRCTYCFQKHIRAPKATASMDHLKGFCNFVDSFIECNPNRIVTCELFGGEPLMTKNKPLIEAYFEWLTSRNLSTVITTNGSEVCDYVDILLARRRHISAVNLTVDGPEDIHNARRPIKHTQNAFATIEKIIDILIEGRVPVAVSMNLDSENIDFLEETMKYIVTKELTSHPGQFYFYICKVADHLKNSYREACLNEGELLCRVLPVLKRTPRRLLNVTQVSFLRILSNLAHGFGLISQPSEKGRARFHHCCASSPVDTYYFCPDNLVHRCSFAIGSSDMAIGTFDANQTNINSTLKNWRERAFFKIEKCRRCSIGPVCGGGCIIDGNSGRLEESCAERFESLDIFCREILPAWIRESTVGARMELVK
jgi:uncharacterized protein